MTEFGQEQTYMRRLVFPRRIVSGQPVLWSKQTDNTLAAWVALSAACFVYILAFQFIAPNETSRVARALLNIACGVVALFSLAMLADCLTGNRTQSKQTWFVAMLLLPVLSAFAYFFVTRRAK
jgi:hypothetical protein